MCRRWLMLMERQHLAQGLFLRVCECVRLVFVSRGLVFRIVYCVFLQRASALRVTFEPRCTITTCILILALTFYCK
jgi:hypothetical protein